MAASAALGVGLAPGGLALVDGTGLEEGDEFVEIGALEGSGFEGEVLVGAEVVHPEALDGVRLAAPLMGD